MDNLVQKVIRLLGGISPAYPQKNQKAWPDGTGALPADPYLSSADSLNHSSHRSPQFFSFKLFAEGLQMFFNLTGCGKTQASQSLRGAQATRQSNFF
jgi:hypothetical protein